MLGVRLNIVCLTLLLFALNIHHIHAQTPSNSTEKISTGLTTATKISTSEDVKSTDSKTEEVIEKASRNGCGEGCEICHENHCFACNNGYSRVDYKCEKKGCDDEKCLDCSSEVCYKCVDGFAPNLDGFCTWIGPTGCDEKDCLLCEQTRIGCTECMPGFQLRSNKCVKNACADKNCMRCSSNGKTCEVCSEGFQSRLGECLEVGCLDDHCKQCSPSGGSCYQCEPGYYTDTDENCKLCPDSKCLNCNGSQNTCLKCIDGYFVGRTRTGEILCLECALGIENCSTCGRDGDDCHECLDGYYLEHGHCIKCPESCTSCKSPWFCDVCKDGYDLYANGLCKMGDRAALASNAAENVSPLWTLFAIALIHVILTGWFM